MIRFQLQWRNAAMPTKIVVAGTVAAADRTPGEIDAAMDRLASLIADNKPALPNGWLVGVATDDSPYFDAVGA